MTAVPASRPDDSAFADRRAFPRVPVAMPAFLQADGDRHAVQILDLSAGGAKLTCAAALSAGAAVTLDCGTLRRAAVVRWRNDGVVGLCFDSELDAREISALIARSSALANRMSKPG